MQTFEYSVLADGSVWDYEAFRWGAEALLEEVCDCGQAWSVCSLTLRVSFLPSRM